MKILFINNQRKYKDSLGKYNYSGKGYSQFWNWELFREEIFRQADVTCCGWGYDPEWKKDQSLLEIIKKVDKPNVILSHRDFHNCKDYNEITNILKVHFAGDYFSSSHNYPKFKRGLQGYNFDLVFGASSVVVKQLQKEHKGKKQFVLPNSADLHVFRKLNLAKRYDVAASFTIQKRDSHLFRYKILEMIQDMDISAWTGHAWFDAATIKINQVKICINENTEFKFVNTRIPETLACGTFLLTDESEDLIKFGYKDRYHLVIFDGLNDLKEKIYYYLKHEKEREQIAQQGMKFVRTNYSNEKRVKKLLEFIQDELD